jgi:toxin FitB
MYLLDTNVVAEIRKRRRANPGVRAFFKRVAADQAPAFPSVGVNGPDRRHKEVADIEMLMDGAKLDWHRVENFYDTFGLKDEADRLKQRFGDA